jgi:predicted O-methyltransferase YrrM
MAQELWTAVDRYFNNRLAPEDSVLRAAIEASHAAALPPIQVSATQGKLLLVLARAMRARAVLEIGTLGGYSTIWLARALPADGRLVTCELNPKHAEVARANLERAGLAARVDIRVGRAVDSLAQLIASGTPPFDLVFIDADKASYPDYLRTALRLSHPGTLIIADNVVRHGRVLEEHPSDADLRGIRDFMELLAATPGLLTTALQTVGEKGHDGLALALVTGAT